MSKDQNNAKNYLKAKSAEGLKILMIRNNLSTASYHDYRIMHDGKDFYAWFEFDASEIIKAETDKVLNGIQS